MISKNSIIANTITVDGAVISRAEVIVYMQLMEQQKERVDAVLLAIKDQLEPGTFSFILTDLAKSLQEDHKYWYQLQGLLGIRADVLDGVDHE